jgi:lipoyl(octanoyl) transferase
MGYTELGAPGIYVNSAKIASIGLRVRKGCTYHGMALNVNGDLAPFLMINPCGYQNLKMTKISDFVPNIQISTVYQKLTQILSTLL